MMLPSGWRKVKLGDVVKMSSGGTPSKDNASFWNGDIPWISALEMHKNFVEDAKLNITEEALKKGSSLAKKNDLLLLTRGSMLWKRIPVCLCLRDVAFNQDVKCLHTNEMLDPTFLLYWFGCMEPKIMHMVVGTGIGAGKLESSGILDLEVDLPPIEEQKKIASTLSVWDSAIEKMEKLIEAKSHNFNLLMEKLIVKQSLKNQTKTYFIKDLFDVVNRKNKVGNANVLTSSAQYGLVNQQEYYKKNIASSDVSGYYLLEKGDFAYNRSYSTGYPYGVIKRLDKYESGVLSILYLCMTLKEPYRSFSDYFVFLFESGYLNNQLALICREGARNHGLLNVSKEDFFNMKVQLPNEKELQNIVCILQNHSRELSLLKQQLENYKRQKQGLMQKLLTGQWLVK